MPVEIWHNPRCSKSREACALLDARSDAGSVEVIEYLKTPLALERLRLLQSQLGLPVRALLRDGEVPYKELGLADPGLSDEELLRAIIAAPILLQRPIVVRNDRAVIARPPELLEALFERG